MNMKLRNRRGLGSNFLNKRFLNKLIKDRGPDVMLIQETKSEKFEVSVVRRLWGIGDPSFAESEA